MNRRFLPSVSGLLAFESAARHGSITAAASELNLTQSAVSRQIRQLEDFLDVGLFQRIHQRVQLTNTGRAYLSDVARILGELSSATHRTVTGAGATCSLSLAVLPTFGTRWLVPRLPSFVAMYPDVMLRLSVRTCAFEFATDSVDAAIHYGSANWPGGVASLILDEVMVAVCSPAFQDENDLKTPSDFNRVTLLHEATRLWAWPDWFRRQGVDKVHASRGPCFEQSLMLSQAAVSGLGVALLPTFVVEEELSNGTLVQPVKHELVTERAYYLVVPESTSTSPVIQNFKLWLAEQARSSRLSKGKPSADMAVKTSLDRSRHLRKHSLKDSSEINGIVQPWKTRRVRLQVASAGDR